MNSSCSHLVVIGGFISEIKRESSVFNEALQSHLIEQGVGFFPFSIGSLIFIVKLNTSINGQRENSLPLFLIIVFVVFFGKLSSDCVYLSIETSIIGVHNIGIVSVHKSDIFDGNLFFVVNGDCIGNIYKFFLGARFIS